MTRAKKVKAIRKKRKANEREQAKVLLDRVLRLGRRAAVIGSCQACGGVKQNVQTPGGLLTQALVHAPECLVDNAPAIERLRELAGIPAEQVRVL